jgi:uncharacterized circularly permuted ATP-grasp superfamily protein/uncharacterized alpha-E superfamily protein
MPASSAQVQKQSQSLAAGQRTLALEPRIDGAGADALLRRTPPPEAGVWDELREAQRLRPLWQRFAQYLPAPAAGLDMAADLDRRCSALAQQLRQDGVTHNVFSETGVATRPWSLELLPLLIGPAEWARIEVGISQRARLLEAVMSDAYGAQRLLHESLLPPALLHRHPGYLRGLVGARPACGLHLYIAAFDLARGPDGQWWLVAQRTQGPSGLGYVLHNRILVARQFSDAFREMRVQHIASAYRRLLDTIETHAAALLGPGEGSAPRVVLLTAGTYSETYFEHAYLARYLGLPLVEGSELTVRDGRLHLKTVQGLERVHGVLRRLDDDFCDPLELRPDSALGVPGLLQAVRSGQVVLANALGSGFLESPAVHGFLPAISRALLGEELCLPALPTWWCGEAASYADARGEMADKLLRSTFPRGGRTAPVSSPPQDLIEADPDAWTLQQRLRFARAALWQESAVVLRPAMLRVYAIADGAGGFSLLPGGMTRVARREDMSVSMQRGGSSLDTWVLTEGPVDTFSMLPQRLQVDDIGLRHRPVSSRTGENLFWLGRYTERTEQLVRLAKATLGWMELGREGDEGARQALASALSTLAVNTGLAPPGVPSLHRAPQLFERALLAGLGDAPEAFSVPFNLRAIERAGLNLRERLSPEQWTLLRQMAESFALALEVPDGELPALPQVLPALDRLAVQLAAVTGAQTDRMTRDAGWRLLTVGRLCERLIGLTERLAAFAQSAALLQASGIETLLDLFDSLITFRARYQRHEDLLAMTELLVLDDTNPRALAGVLRRLRTELRKLPGKPADLAPLLARLPAEGGGLELEELRGASEERIAQVLACLARGLNESASALALDLAQRYFALLPGDEELHPV